jgi:D-alanyl-D-alanine carboxypeptidase
MSRRVFAGALLAAVAFVGCGGDQAQKGAAARSGPRLTDRMARQLDATLRETVAAAGIPGASAAIVFPDGRTWSGAAGVAVVRPKRAMTPDTALPFDSVTKVATAAMALRLAEQGRLSLDDPIERWYPAWRGDPQATVRDLLGHTSGARDAPDAFFRAIVDHPRTRVTPREYLAATPRPGPRSPTEGEYANSGFVIAGLIIERAAREPIDKAMRRGLFRHPGGAGLALQPGERTREPRAHSYHYPSGGPTPTDLSDGGPLIPFRSIAGTAGTAGALAGDVPSLARWGHALLSGRVLKPESLRDMTRFHSLNHLTPYGLGLARDVFDGRTMWGHIGDGIGSFTEFWHLPRVRLTIAVSWNDDVLDHDGQIFPQLLRTALG